MDKKIKRPNAITRNDWRLLRIVDAFKVLTVSQLAVLSQRSRQAVRKRLRDLKGAGIISIRQQLYGAKRGRPENFIVLTTTGCHQLNEKKGVKHKESREDKAVDSSCVNHEILVNWLLIHLIQINRECPQLRLNFATRFYSTIERKQPHPKVINNHIVGDRENLSFIPDGVFIISDIESNKSLLFFLEVDMGTETRVSRMRESKDIRQKIVNYQHLFRSQRYKFYERYFKVPLTGFRLLFVTHTKARSTSLGQLVSAMPPSDFIWLTNQENLFSHGISDKIWAKGGSDKRQVESILGNTLSFGSKLVIP